MKILPQDENPTTVHVPSNTITTAHVSLTPGEGFTITFSGSFYLYFNGSGSCSDALEFSET